MRSWNRNKENIVAMVPARKGSTRLTMKNLALLNGKPLIFYAIQAAREANIFSRIVVNSEDRIFKKIAERYEVNFYKRPPELATSETKSDSVVYDFLKKCPCDILVWVNPTSPLQTGEEIKRIVNYFLKEKLDSLITVKEESVHCMYQGKPINFKFEMVFAQTQNLIPVTPFVYSVMIWRSDLFIKTFETKGHAFFCGKVGYYPVHKLSSIMIKRKEDLMLAEGVLKVQSKQKEFEVSYDEIIHE